MIESLFGLPHVTSALTVCIDTKGGVTYSVTCPAPVIASIKSDNEDNSMSGPVRILTVLRISDTSHDLYGFIHEEDRQMFLTLTGVNGVGAKTAITILSAMTTEEIRQIIALRDEKALTAIRGVGPKTVAEIFIDLADKFQPKETPIQAPRNEHLIEALKVLGFKAKEAAERAAIAEGQGPADLQTLIKIALKK